MSSVKHHDYHLVDPSPRPLLASFSAFFMALGGALCFSEDYVHIGKIVFPLGIIALIYCAYTWWRDVVREGIHDKAHNKVVRSGLRFGMVLFIVSEIMFFFAFFWSFFKAFLAPEAQLDDMGIWPVAEGVWPPEGIETLDAWDIPFTNTLILLLSGTTVTWAHHALLQEDHKSVVRALAITVALGVIFTGFQIYEYHVATFAFDENIYTANFYMATGFHGAHVLIGTIFLAVCLVRSMKGQFTPENHLGFEFAAWYWHFVDVVWIFLFVCVYWFGG